jgi:hypothetical protein
VNLENVSFSDKQELIAKLGIMVYPSEDHKTVRIASKLPIMRDKVSCQIISITSPVLIIPRKIKGAQAYLEVLLGDSS